MTHQTTDKTQFFITPPSPCPYLEGKEERKLFTHLTGRRAIGLHHLLSEHGFRRSQNLIYRPACEGCAACKSARVICSEFGLKKRHKRLLKANSDIEVEVIEPIAEQEHFNLFMRYLGSRHQDGGMAEMSFSDFEYMVEDTPVDTVLVEYRMHEKSEDKKQPGRGQLVAVALTDIMEDGFSMVYSFYDPDLWRRGLGNFMVLDHIARAQREELAYVYLGYWVEESPKMHYKSGFKPLEIQEMHSGWQLLK